MAISKVILNGATQMDVTGDTVNAGNLLASETATRNDGVQITGTVDLDDYVSKSGDTMTGSLVAPNVCVDATSGNPSIYIRSSGNDCVRFLQRAGGGGSLRIRLYTTPGSSSTGYEDFTLPAATNASGSASYEILTTKTFSPFYVATDTFSTIDLMPCVGYITHNADRIYLSFNVNKSMANITSISVTTLTGTIRTADGNYIGGSSSSVNWLTNNTVTAIKVTDYTVRVLIQFTAAPTNATNNSIVCGALNIGLTFA